MAKKTAKKTASKAPLPGTCTLKKQGSATVIRCEDSAAARKVLTAASRQAVSDALIKRLAAQAAKSFKKSRKGSGERPVLSERDANTLWQHARAEIAAHLGAVQTGAAAVDSRARFMNALEDHLPLGEQRFGGSLPSSTDLFGPSDFKGYSPADRRFSAGQGDAEEMFGMSTFEGVKPEGKSRRFSAGQGRGSEEFGFSEFEGVKPTRTFRGGQGASDEEFGFAEFEGAVKPTRIPSPSEVRAKSRSRISPPGGRGSARRPTR